MCIFCNCQSYVHILLSCIILFVQISLNVMYRQEQLPSEKRPGFIFIFFTVDPNFIGPVQVTFTLDYLKSVQRGQRQRERERGRGRERERERFGYYGQEYTFIYSINEKEKLITRVRLTLSAYWFVVHSYTRTFFTFVISAITFTLVSARPRPIIITTKQSKMYTRVTRISAINSSSDSVQKFCEMSSVTHVDSDLLVYDMIE